MAAPSTSIGLIRAAKVIAHIGVAIWDTQALGAQDPHCASLLQTWAQSLREVGTRLVSNDGPILPGPPVPEAIRPASGLQSVSVVTPVYRELNTGTLARLVQSFFQQDVPTSEFELIFVVNNTPEAAAQRDLAFIENQDTLAILRYVAGQGSAPPPVLRSLSIEQQNIFSRARERRLRIVVVDHSTNGIERNIGLIRSEGVSLAMRSHHASPEHIIASMDGDTTVPPHYIRTLQTRFREHQLSAAFLPLRFRIQPETSMDHARTALADRVIHLQIRLIWAIERQMWGPLGGGMQSVGTVRAFERIGGYPRIPQAEDITVAGKLARTGTHLVLNELPLTASDRARQDSYSGAVRGQNIAAQLLQSRVAALQAQTRRLLEHIGDLAFQSTTLDIRSPRILARLEYLGLPPDWVRPTTFPANLPAPEAWLRTSTDEFLMQMIRRHVNPEEVQAIERRIEQLEATHDQQVQRLRAELLNMIRGLPYEGGHEFLQGNLWIRSVMATRRSRGESDLQILEWLEQEFPDWLLPVRAPTGASGSLSGPAFVMRSCIRVQFLTDLFNEAQDHPTHYPTLSQMVMTIGRPRY